MCASSLAIALLTTAQAQSFRRQPPPGPPPPGVVINYCPPETRQYLGSPSIAILPGGDYVVSHDYFGPGSTQQVTSVFRSTDRGRTWTHATDLDGQWWSGLLVHRGKLYLFGNSKWLGDVIIRRSDDGGTTWTEPRDYDSGVLLRGRYHTSAMPFVVHAGRIWRTMELSTFEGETRDWTSYAFMMSAPVDSDLTKASSWSSSELLRTPDGYNNWREGNAVATPDGGIVNLIRIHLGADKAALIRLSADGRRASYDAEKDLIDFPGGATKFTIRFDQATGRYWSLVNKAKNPPAGRNLLALVWSTDLRNWHTQATLLHHPDRATHAFQYADWQFDGDDIVAAVRTAWDGAPRAHDSNYITFHRFEKFRTLSAERSAK